MNNPILQREVERLAERYGVGVNLAKACYVFARAYMAGDPSDGAEQLLILAKLFRDDAAGGA